MTDRMALSMLKRPPTLPCAPEEAADSPENSVTIPAAVI